MTLRPLDFQDILLQLQIFWSKQGCTLMQPYDTEMGAGTFHPATVLRSLGDEPWSCAFAQPCRRPTDGRYGESPNRLQHYYQFQVLMKPAPANIQSLYLESLHILGIHCQSHDIRFVEDDWESPTLGAWGLGWEIWCNGMEISQFTYFQQIGGLSCTLIPIEITYGLERLAMYIQNVDNVYDIKFDSHGTTYGKIFLQQEQEFSRFNFDIADVTVLFNTFEDAQKICQDLIQQKLPLPAYDHCIKTSHLFNILDARGVISSTERPTFIKKIRALAKQCCELWLEKQTPLHRHWKD